MAANFWHSSHCASWLVDRSRVLRSNPRDADFFGSHADVWLLRRYFMDVIHELGVRLSLRQRVISTAQVLFKRFYLNASFSSFDPRLVAPTLLFVAAKVEECPLNAKLVIAKLNKLDTPVSSSSGANSAHLGLTMPTALLMNASAPTAAAAAASAAWTAAASSAGAVVAPSSSSSAVTSKPPALPYLYSVEDLLEMEFAVLNGLGYDLVVFHPYRPLMQFVSDMNQPEVMQMSHEIVNDSYRLDVCLTHPPYLVAIAAIYVACNFQEKEYRTWFRKLNVEHEQILDISRDLLQLWDEAESYATPATNTRILALLCKLNEKKFGTLAQLHAAAAAKDAAALSAANRALSASPTSTLSTPPPSSRAGSAQAQQPAAGAAHSNGERDAKRMRMSI